MRIVEYEIAGKVQYLSFSAATLKSFTKRYNGFENLEKVLEGKGESEALEEVIWILSELIKSGSQYMRIIEEKDVKGWTLEELNVLIGLDEIENIALKITEAFTISNEREVETESPNGETTQV